MAGSIAYAARMTSATKATTHGTAARKPSLPAIDPFSEQSAVPSWVRKQHPAYGAHAHTTGPIASTRAIAVQGHELTVRTTYEVFMDGKALPVHMMVDSDGRLWSHLCPYHTFATAPELLEFVLTHAPEALNGLLTVEHTHHEHNGQPRKGQ